ncbi:MAG: GNAT family N-acetyltransferase [Acidobacteria bacterium]|nr:GNAT family N-acetyltransferase [Acidobacteriota bacterium]
MTQSLKTSRPRDLRTSGPQRVRTHAPRPNAQDPGLRVGPLAPSDLAAVVRLDARLTGNYKAKYWKARFAEFIAPGHGRSGVGLAAREGDRLCGYLLGNVRAFEFGSSPCGWIFAVGVDPDHAHHGIGSALVAEAVRRFRRAGVPTVRTMVRRTDVSMLAFFRSNGFVGGSFTQLELGLVPAEVPAGAAQGPQATTERSAATSEG